MESFLVPENVWRNAAALRNYLKFLSEVVLPLIRATSVVVVLVVPRLAVVGKTNLDALRFAADTVRAETCFLVGLRFSPEDPHDFFIMQKGVAYVGERAVSVVVLDLSMNPGFLDEDGVALGSWCHLRWVWVDLTALITGVILDADAVTLHRRKIGSSRVALHVSYAAWIPDAASGYQHVSPALRSIARLGAPFPLITTFSCVANEANIRWLRSLSDAAPLLFILSGCNPHRGVQQQNRVFRSMKRNIPQRHFLFDCLMARSQKVSSLTCKPDSDNDRPLKKARVEGPVLLDIVEDTG